MAGSQAKIPHGELSGRLQTLMLLRVLFVSLLLGASIFIQVKETKTYFGNIQTSHYLLIATVYFLTIIYILLLKYYKNLTFQAHLQLHLDTLFVTAVVYTTGGIESIFSSLYILSIISGSILLYRPGGLLVASSSSILYGLLLDLHYFGMLHPLGSRLSYPEQYQRAYLFYTILVNIAAFYLVAYLSSYLSEQAKKSRVELSAKQRDIDKLEVLNESIIKSIPSGLIVLDGDDRIILCNPAAEQIFGIKVHHATGSHIHEVLPFVKDHLTKLRAPSAGPIKKHPPLMDLPFTRAEGTELHLRLSLSPLRLPLGEEKGLILIFHDVTQVKRIEEEMKKVEGLALIGELAAGVAHEIRNPMASISGSIQMLKDGLEEDDVNTRLMGIISREINRLNHLVNDFLIFARPKKISVKKFNLNQLILESLELFQNSQHWDGKTKIITNFKEDIALESDPEQIKQVLWNLLLNASEAMAEGGSLYALTYAEVNGSEPHERTVKIVVRDTGTGFDEGVIPHLFTPFVTTKEGGSGLGLAIVKRVVEGLDGTVLGGNHPEGGAEVTISLPQVPPQMPPC